MFYYKTKFTYNGHWVSFCVHTHAVPTVVADTIMKMGRELTGKPCGNITVTPGKNCGKIGKKTMELNGFMKFHQL